MLPRHLQLREVLFSRWKSLGLKKGDPIESQNEILSSCDFSLSTVIKTLRDMELDQIIERKVGLGSFLKQTPWQVSHLRIGFYYNRNNVGSGILSNPFYGPMLHAMEERILSKGNEFSFGSFTRDQFPIDLWNQLDVVILTGIIKDIQLDQFDISSILAFMDSEGQNDLGDSFALDFTKAYDNFCKLIAKQNVQKILYIDSIHKTRQQEKRKETFIHFLKKNAPRTKFESCECDVEFGIHDTQKLIQAVKDFSPDLVCGYIHYLWHKVIHKAGGKHIKIYQTATQKKQSPCFYADMHAWVDWVLEKIGERVANRNLAMRNIYFPVQLLT